MHARGRCVYARAVRLRQVGIAPEEAGGGVARKAVVTVSAGGVGGGVEDISALAARSPTRAADDLAMTGP